MPMETNKGRQQMAKIGWQISGSGHLNIDDIELLHMSLEEFEEYLYDGVALEVHEQSNYHVIFNTSVRELYHKIKTRVEEDHREDE